MSVTMDNEAVRRRLLELADSKYQSFQSGLVPGVDNLLGVRVPDLRKLAKEIAKGDWEAFLGKNGPVMIRNGMKMICCRGLSLPVRKWTLNAVWI